MSNIEESQPPSVLHQFVYDLNWNGVLKRLETNPEEALHTVEETTWMQQDGTCLPEDDLIIEAYDLAPIHILCTRRNLPINVLEAYLKAEPKSIHLLTNDKRTPLHLACYSMQSLEVIQLLAQADPNTLTWKESFDGWNVFHICVHCETEENVMATLLETATPEGIREALATKDRYGRIPIVLACNVRPKVTKGDFALVHAASDTSELERSLLEELSRNYRTILAGALKLKPPPKKPVSSAGPSPYCNPKKALSVESFWLWRPNDSLALWRCLHKALIVLGIQEHDSTIDSQQQLATYPLLHECIRQDPQCNSFLFHALLSLNPFYACQVDPSDGNLPLHVAAQHAENTKEYKNRLATLIVSYPLGASIANKAGELPLEILDRKNIVSWDHMRSLVRCCPVALSRLRIHESLYAQVICMLGEKGYTRTIFSILKETPSLFDH
jgi:hypothetical protein